MTRPDVVPLARALEPFRRRRRRVLAVRFVGTALALSVVAAEALALAFDTSATHSVWLVAGATAAAVVAGLSAAAVRTPSLSETARLLDRRASLKNRAAAGLQFVQHDDPMARLVVRDAVRRIEGLDPTVVFPREAPGGAQWLVAAVAISTLILGVNAWRAGMAPLAGGARSGGLLVPGAPNQASPGAPAARQTAVALAQPAQAPETAAVPGMPASPPRESTPSAAGAPPGLTTPANAAAAPLSQPALTASPATSGVPPDRSPFPVGAAADARRTAAAPGAPSARGAAPAGSGGRGAGAEGAVESGASHEGGGVKGGSVEAGAVPAPRPAGEAGRLSAVEYRAAWARAQAALADERVPPPLRDYVRRYFAAIRSPRTP